MRKGLILTGIAILFVSLVIGFQLTTRPAASPVNNIVAVRPITRAQTVTAATARADAPAAPLRVEREVVITQIVPSTLPPVDDQPGAPVERVVIVLATPTGEADRRPPTAATVAPTRRPQRAQGEQGFDDSPLPTPGAISPLPTPVGLLPPVEIQAAAYSLVEAVIASETAYYEQFGQFAQLLVDDTATCPTGQRCISILYPPGIAAGVNVYVAVAGHGYEVEVIICNWRLIVATGPEAGFRTEGWTYAD